jgi:hypothetical protein
MLHDTMQTQKMTKSIIYTVYSMSQTQMRDTSFQKLVYETIATWALHKAEKQMHIGRHGQNGVMLV